MKRIVLFLIGFFPLLLGYLQNYLMTVLFADRTMPYLLISFGLLLIWFFISVLSVKFFSSKREALVFLNLAAFLVLLLVLFQEIALGRYWFNQIGIASQFFYLPLLNLAFSLVSMVTHDSHLYYAYIVAFGCLLSVSYLGRITGEHRFYIK